MLLRWKVWYKKLTPLQQLSIVVLANWVVWFISSLLEDKVFYQEKHPLIHHIFSAAWMALFMTPLIAWDKVKAVFKPKDNNHPTNSTNKQR